MPQTPYKLGGFTTYRAPAETVDEPSLFDTLDAAFGMENDVVNAWDLMSKPAFAPDPTFKLVETLKASKYWSNYRHNFIGVKSQPEFNYISQKIDNEERQRSVLYRAGWGGVAASIAAGVVSPTLMIPFVGQAKGLGIVGEAATYGLVAAGLQELPLALAQETRTPEEILTSLAAGTVLPGILGGAVAALRPGERAALEEAFSKEPIALAQRSGVGADIAVRPDPGKLAPGAQTIANVLDSNALTRSPVTDNLMSDFTSARLSTAQLADAGLTLEHNALGIPTTLGGTAENAINLWYGNYAKYVDVADDAYARYVFDGTPPTVGRDIRATMRGYTDAQKLSRNEFEEQVWWALSQGDQHENKFVQEAAKAARREIYDPILKDLQATKLLGEELPESADLSYVNWVPNTEAIRADPVKFVDFLAERYNKRLQEMFASMFEKFALRRARETELLEDVARPQEEIDQLREQFQKQLGALEERSNEQQFTALEDTIAQLRSMARKEPDNVKKRQMLADAKEMEQSAGPQFQGIKQERTEINRRLGNLNKAKVVVEAKLEKKLEKIDRSEELSLNGLNRVARAGQRILNNIGKWSDEKLDAELSALRTQFEEVAQRYDRGEERIGRLTSDTDATDAQLLAADVVQEGRADRMTNLAERIADAEDLGREAVRDLMNDMLQETLSKVQRINDRRAVRTARLREQAANLTPEAYASRVAQIEDARRGKNADFEERIRLLGGNDLDINEGKVDFTGYARDQAFKTKDKFLGTYLRLPVVDMMQAERGAVLPRLLSFIPTKDMAPWLHRNANQNARIHLRTMGPDIEITRKLGTVNGQEQFVQMGEEMNAKLDAIEKAVDKKGEPRSEEWKAKERTRVQDEHARVSGNFEAIIKRLRNQYGLPSNPDGIGYRMAKTAMGLNVLRYMGGVTISSLPDVARPIMRYGLTRTFRDGFLPMITNWKAFKMSAREARLAGVAVDAMIHSRANNILDIVDDLGRGSKFERGVDFLSGKQGIIALFSYWTDAMKGVTGAIANAKLMDSIVEVATKDKPPRDLVEFLASNGIDADLAQRIYGEVQKGGGGKVDGVWLPNTEDWTDPIAISGFRTAVAREVNNTITTPGVERPLWTNASTTGRMISQFKSFAFASTTRTLMAGLQQRDANFAIGTAISLAMGAMSYYLYSIARGGDTYERMQNADIAEWADQAIQRSGVMAIFGLGQDLLTRIPATAPLVSFSGNRSTRRGGDDLVEAALGPTFDFATTAARVLTDIANPTQGTVHAARTLLPWQNLTVMSRGFDALEKTIPVGDNQ